LWQCWKGLILLLNTIIPLSLYFCYNSASWILAKKLERQFNIKIQPHGTCSFQNQINSICTDKTGTLSLGNTLLYKVAFQFQESSCVQSSSSLQDKPSVCQILAARVLSVTDLAVHSETRKILCCNDLEFTLLNFLMKHGGITIRDN